MLARITHKLPDGRRITLGPDRWGVLPGIPAWIDDQDRPVRLSKILPDDDGRIEHSTRTWAENALRDCLDMLQQIERRRQAGSDPVVSTPHMRECARYAAAAACVLVELANALEEQLQQ